MNDKIWKLKRGVAFGSSKLTLWLRTASRGLSREYYFWNITSIVKKIEVIYDDTWAGIEAKFIYKLVSFRGAACPLINGR